MQCRPGNQRGTAPVDRVAQYWVLDVGQMDADLVRAPGSQRDLEQGVAAGNAQPDELRDRLPAAGHHHHPLPVLDVAADGRLDPRRRIGHLTHHDRPVATRHHPLLQLAGKRAMRLVIARDHDQPGGVAVEPVDDPRTLGAADRRPAGSAGQQPMNQRAGGMPGSRVHHQPCRLVDDDQVVILVEHAEVHGLGLQPGGRGRR